MLSDTAAASLFTRPSSRLRYIGERTISGQQGIITHSGAFLDWWELTYRHLYRARNNRLVFSSGAASGPAEFTISGFSSSDLVLIDITDFFNPTVLTDTQISGTGPYTLRFRDDLTAGPRRYAALARSNGGLQVASGALALVHPTTLANPGTEPDYVIVVPDVRDVDGDGSPDDFAAEAQRLKQHRESKGHVVQILRLSDLYNEFDGGLARSVAIRNYLRHAFSHWTRPPLYLLLAGDGSEDFRDKLATGVSVVPTELIIGPVIGDGDLQLVAADSWFVCGIAPGDVEFDDHLDMSVGRLPAQSASELRSLIDKTIEYENFAPDDRWRSRILTISDDSWSSTISFSAPYQFRIGERIFEAISDTINSIVENQSGVGDLIDSRALKLSVYTDPLPSDPCPQPGPCRSQAMAISHFDTAGATTMYQLISDGNLLVNYQGHANAWTLAHEWIFYSEGVDQDQNRFNNLGRPGVWFVYACHPNQFGYRDERVGNVVGGRERGFGELLVSLPDRGAVAAIGSSGFEYLPIGLGSGPPFQGDLNTPQWEAFFLTPPDPDST
ncbi:MAG TPA: C25 family cysteine peptidase, partial [Candidatus Udaeobacter sp.]|nr:C25 family cysteine peptidase [Candidatus Udaeobacter sp.]